LNRLGSLEAYQVEIVNDVVGNEEAPLSENSENLPDVYYIILDGYGRVDGLERRYALNNSVFLGQLEERNLYIAEEAMTNSSTTILSVTSSLRMDNAAFCY